jgi:formylglycine-generating enzyme required for sulfatase activity
LLFGWLVSFMAAHVVVANEARAEPQLQVAQARQPERPAEPAMVRVPAGSFYFGCNESEDSDCYRDEKPGGWIALREFKIDRTEVTVSAYEACVQAEACRKPGIGDPCNWGESGREDHPINCVTWYQARAYCAWVGKRLPSEQEWEKAARGTDGRIYPWGNEPASCAHAVMDDGSGRGCGRDSMTWPVGSKPSGASPYGALDMVGNVWEWTASWSRSTQPARAVVRGGPWRGNPRYLRASNRGGANPALGYGGSGFRCAR